MLKQVHKTFVRVSSVGPGTTSHGSAGCQEQVRAAGLRQVVRGSASKDAHSLFLWMFLYTGHVTSSFYQKQTSYFYFSHDIIVLCRILGTIEQ